ncbi:MAG: beta-phosphoglucomutase [Lysobacteraceae bacterium]
MHPAPPTTAGAEAGWCLHRRGDDPATRTRDDALFALANGALGVRGGAPEAVDGSGGCFLAAVYERHPIEFHERLPGFVRGTDTRVPVADGCGIALVPGDDPDAPALDPDACASDDVERMLDLRTGTLRHARVLRTPSGTRLRIESERVVAHDRDLVAIRFRVTSIDHDGPLILRSRLRSGRHAAKQGEDPRIGSAGSRELETTACAANAAVATLVQRTLRSGITVACVQAHRLDAADAADGGAEDGGLAFLGADVVHDGATQQFIARLRPGTRVTLAKFVAYAHAADGEGRDADALRDTATAIATQAAQAGYAAIAAARAAVLDAFWRDAGLAVDADPELQRALRFNLFHLLQSASRDAASGTAAKGLTGEGYEGHCFWDTEVFVLPVMVFTAPEIARAMLLYRHRTLDAARANARELNHPTGALYPWRTIAGGECSAHYPSGSAAYHINADIAYAIGLYLDATDDIGFLLEAGAEMLFETARIWPQAGHFDPLRDGAFGIHAVTGPDEYTALVDNNFYTNRMAQRHLQRAVAVWERLGRTHSAERAALAGRLRLDEDEIALWRRAAATMQLRIDPHHGIYAQDDTFLHKPRWEFSQHGRAGQDGARALLLDHHPLTLYRYQVCKQTDVVMALVLAGDGLDAEATRRSFDYYEAITTHDSTLSPAIHGILACQLGLHEPSRAFFHQTLRVDLDDLHGNTDHGVHMAAMAGSWLGLAWGFAGLRVVDGALCFAPTLPAGWRGYRVGLRWRGRRLEVSVAADGVAYRLHDGEPLRIRHHGRTLDLQAGTWQRVATDAPATASPEVTSPMFPRPCRALIFDLDGVLTDTAHVHYRAWKRLADELGIAFDETVNRRLKGVDRMGSLEILLEAAPRAYGDAEKQALAERKNAYYREAIAGFGADDLFPGVRGLLHAAKAAGLRLGLASASRNAPALLQRLGIADAFDTIADPAASRPKPHPDLFLAAAAALGVDPRDCIGIEDAASGIAAIRAAGMAAVGIGDADELRAADLVLPAIDRLALERLVSRP